MSPAIITNPLLTFYSILTEHRAGPATALLPVLPGALRAAHLLVHFAQARGLLCLRAHPAQRAALHAHTGRLLPAARLHRQDQHW